MAKGSLRWERSRSNMALISNPSSSLVKWKELHEVTPATLWECSGRIDTKGFKSSVSASRASISSETDETRQQWCMPKLTAAIKIPLATPCCKCNYETAFMVPSPLRLLSLPPVHKYCQEHWDSSHSYRPDLTSLGSMFPFQSECCSYPYSNNLFGKQSSLNLSMHVCFLLDHSWSNYPQRQQAGFVQPVRSLCTDDWSTTTPHHLAKLHPSFVSQLMTQFCLIMNGTIP